MTFRLITILIGLMAICTSCLLPEEPAEERVKQAEKNQGDILVGAVAPWSTIDVMLWEGIQLGVEEINRKGGLLGRKIRILRRDDENSVEKGVAMGQELSNNPDLVAVVGHYQSFVSLPASVIYQYYGVFMLCTVDTDPELTRQGFPLIFRTVPDDLDYGKKLAAFCSRKGFNQMALFLQQNEYGRDFSDAFATAAGDVGIELLDGESYNATTTPADIRNILQRWKEHTDLDAILLSGELPQAAVIIREARRLGLKQPIVGGIKLDRKKLIKLLNHETGDVYFPTVFDPGAGSPEARRFVNAFQKRYGKAPDVLAAQGYDTITCLRYAIQKARSTAPPEMAKALRSAKDLKGVTGALQFTPEGARIVDHIVIKTLENGKFIILKNRAEGG